MLQMIIFARDEKINKEKNCEICLISEGRFASGF